MDYFALSGGLFMISYVISRRFQLSKDSCENFVTKFRHLVSNPESVVQNIALVSNYVSLKTRIFFSEYAECGKVSSTKEHYTITYFNGSQRYQHKFQKRRGSLGIVTVMAANKDITEQFREYLGPGQNFHGTKPTPKFLGFDEGLIITFMDGRVLEYEPDEQIFF